ncbi:MAG: response regulator [Acidobacteria bacterium]|nr:response regulator [Acidobacteriota bacterium]
MAETHFVILCVDDEPAVLHPLEIMLKRRGYTVVTAADGPSALDLFRQIKFDAVVLDYSMPGMSGGEVAEKIRQENATVPIILHTGYKELDDPLLANVTSTLPKGSLNFLITKLNDLLPAVAPVSAPAPPTEASPEVSPEGPAAQSAHVA